MNRYHLFDTAQDVAVKVQRESLDDVHHVSTTMCACMALGVKFALDDFGTDYSSLTYLRRLSAKIIKIDQTFVRDMLVDTDDLAQGYGIPRPMHGADIPTWCENWKPDICWQS